MAAEVIHRDVKSSNVMLDEGFNAKLGDFGLARLVDHSRNATTTLLAGTYGYIAPEANVKGNFTEKTDVFSFGAMALEVATGMRACDFSAGEDDIVLVDKDAPVPPMPATKQAARASFSSLMSSL
ncbi:hypothetical protein R1sor_016116 [Riccia sorocarpa]|uniref:Protein kinase domain-containing protein n=1 Tax=Riccia sorocarpa TaxID=122646 RepID=A0ABD3HE42_9MARC